MGNAATLGRQSFAGFYGTAQDAQGNGASISFAEQARKGTDMGKPGKGFDAGVEKLSGKYGKASAKKIMGKKFQQMREKGQL